MCKNILLTTINAYPIIITLASIFYSLVSLNMVGIWFAILNVLFGFVGNYYLKQGNKYLFPNWK